MQPQGEAWGCTQEWSSNSCHREFHGEFWKESKQNFNCCLGGRMWKGVLMLEQDGGK